MARAPSPSYSITLRIEMPNQVGIFGKIATVIGNQGGDIIAADIVRTARRMIIRDFTVNTRDEVHEREIIHAVRKIEKIRIIHVTDRTFQQHHGGKIGIHNKIPVKNRNDLSRLYTPGVARVCRAITDDIKKVYRYTIKSNSVAIVTDGSAVLGLGDIGAEAALPVMEGKAMIFREFAHIDAFPICLSTKDPDKIIQTVQAISPVFGGINLEDISSPRCFLIEAALTARLDIPVFHDDQHGTAIVVLAALMNCTKIIRKSLHALKIVIAGAGAAGTACCKLLMAVGVRHIIMCDSSGILYRGRKKNMNSVKRCLADQTNPKKIKGSVSQAIENADVFIGVSSPNIISVKDIKKMSRNPVVFALANPEPEIDPEDALPHAKILATGRSDYPNQINNMLCFPGIFRGLLDVQAYCLNDEIKLAAAKAIASVIAKSELSEDYIIPSIFDRGVVSAVASAVEDAARRTGLARRKH